jgi:hypothetical protein
MDKEEEFLKKLRDLLEEYNASISWDCDSCSDMHGVTGEYMAILLKNKVIYKAPYQNYLGFSDIDLT